MKSIDRLKIKDGKKHPVKVLQFGEGNFLRGFVDWMFDIINEKADFNAGIQIIQPLNRGTGKLINAQDGLYHVLLEGIENQKKIQNIRLITSVNGVINPYEDYQTFLDLGKNPEVEFIISNTTEAGIQFDAEDSEYQKVPHTFPAKLTALLYRRYLHFNSKPPEGLTILPCELIENNGEKLKICILKYVELWSLPKGFRDWIEHDITFCNTLVDRIVPGFPADRLTGLHKQLCFEDQLIVNAEHFHLWVIQGPEHLKEKLYVKEARLNIVVTDDLQKYRTRKVRILNGAHTAMVGYGILNGFEKVKDVVEDEKAGQFIRKLIFEEIIPSVEIEKSELESYANDVLERFQNPFIQHYLTDISLNSISKFKVRVLPSLLSYIDKFDKLPEGLATAFVYLILFYQGKFGDTELALKDDENTINFFKQVWALNTLAETLNSILSNDSLWGTDLTKVKYLSEFMQNKIEDVMYKHT
jgi:tagaturonate reductase